MVDCRLGRSALQGGIFVDPTTDAPYLFHVALVSVLRRPDPAIARLAHEEDIEYRLVGLKQFDGDRITPCPVEHLLLLRGGQGLPPVAQRLAVAARDYSSWRRRFYWSGSPAAWRPSTASNSWSRFPSERSS